MISDISNIEKERKSVQNLIDKSRTKLDRNKMGQYATPNELAVEIMLYTESLLSQKHKITFLDPALGSGSFYSAFLQVFDSSTIEESFGVEIDGKFASTAESLWSSFGLHVINEDFTLLNNSEKIKKADLLICNPPYVRHHHINSIDKQRYVHYIKSNFRTSISKLAGLYCHFMFYAHNFLKDDGISVWLIPSEFMDVNYGVTVKEYLLNEVELIRIHRFNPENVKFTDALVSSVVVWFRKTNHNPDSKVSFTYGDSIHDPSKTIEIDISALKSTDKWSGIFQSGKAHSNDLNKPKIKDLFNIKRGIATGNNSYFILEEDEVEKLGLPKIYLRPILPSPKYIETDIIQSDNSGNPILTKRYFVLDCNLEKEKIDNKFQSLKDYINYGESKGIESGYICRNRNPWYSQEKRESPLFVCNYIGRENSTKAFRFILNKSKSIVTNSYLGIYPKPIFYRLQESDPELSYQILEMLNSITAKELYKNGRVYGGGMYKMEPKELENVELNLPVSLMEYIVPSKQLVLFEQKNNYGSK